MSKKQFIEFEKGDISNKVLFDLYRKMLYPRLVEEKMLNLLRQGRISKWFSGIGQEAISVGVTAALEKDEFIFPLHRNLGVFTTREMPLDRLFAQWQGKKSGYSKGRDRSFHFGQKDFHIVGMISHLGPQLTWQMELRWALYLTMKEKFPLPSPVKEEPAKEIFTKL
jgi:2-oxoisovalerate dehydrogenase E1 component